MGILSIFNRKPQPQPIEQKKDIKGVIQRQQPRIDSVDVQDLKTALRIAQQITNPLRYRLIDIYDNIINFDSHLFGVINKRLLSLQSSELQLLDANGEEIDQSITESTRFQQFIRALAMSVFYGYSSGQMYFEGGKFDFYEIPRQHFSPKTKQVLRQQTDSVGVALDTYEDYYYIGDCEQYGLLLNAVFYAILKRNAVSDWADLIQTYGSPITTYKYSGNDSKTKDAIEKAMTNQGSNAMLQIPEAVESTITYPNPSGNIQKTFFDTMNAEISKLILGNTMTTEDGSSRSQAEVHLSEQQMILRSDKVIILNWLNENFLQYLPLLGINNCVAIKFENHDTMTDIEKVDLDIKLKQLIPNVDPQFFIDKYNVPQAQDIKTGNLASVLGVGGLQSLQMIISDVNLTREQKINILIIVFGINQSDATNIIGNEILPTI